MNSPLSMLALFCGSLAVLFYWGAIGFLAQGYGRPDTQSMPFTFGAMLCWCGIAVFGVSGMFLGLWGWVVGGARRIAALAFAVSVFALFSTYHRWMGRPVVHPASALRTAETHRLQTDNEARKVRSDAAFRKRLADEWHNEMSLFFDRCTMYGTPGSATCSAVATDVSLFLGKDQLFYVRVRGTVSDRIDLRVIAQPTPISTRSTVTVVFDGAVAPSKKSSFEGTLPGTVSQTLEGGDTRIVPVEGKFHFSGETLAGALAFELPESSGRPASRYQLAVRKKPDEPAK